MSNKAKTAKETEPTAEQTNAGAADWAKQVVEHLVDAQKKWIESLNNAGYLAVVCRGFEEAKTEILDYLKTREPMLII